jgi:peptidoglycan/xylan/chitin deacetylase (PgdA/CDA1 family)
MIRVAQCWDDGVATDIRLIEIFRKYNVKATFNLNPALYDKNQQRKIRTIDNFDVYFVAAKDIAEIYQGFSLASHTMHHYNAGRVSDEVFLKDAVDARKVVEDICGKECRGFAWPSGLVTDSTAELLREAGFAYARTTKNTSQVVPCKDPMRFDSSCHFRSPQFREIFADAKASGGAFYFWGHSYEMLDDAVRWQQMEDNLKFLCEDPDVVWVDVVDLVKDN